MGEQSFQHDCLTFVENQLAQTIFYHRLNYVNILAHFHWYLYLLFEQRVPEVSNLNPYEAGEALIQPDLGPGVYRRGS